MRPTLVRPKGETRDGGHTSGAVQDESRSQELTDQFREFVAIVSQVGAVHRRFVVK
jgi:hypothetical protein